MDVEIARAIINIIIIIFNELQPQEGTRIQGQNIALNTSSSHKYVARFPNIFKIFKSNIFHRSVVFFPWDSSYPPKKDLKILLLSISPRSPQPIVEKLPIHGMSAMDISHSLETGFHPSGA